MPMDMWSFAVQHACEMLRCKKLRLAGDGKAPRCWPFGTYIALRIPGGSKSFHPFEMPPKCVGAWEGAIALPGKGGDKHATDCVRAAAADVEIILQESPPGDHKAAGAAENAVKRVKGLART
eukprot:4361263-Amphidinium_carterae.3